MAKWFATLALLFQAVLITLIGVFIGYQTGVVEGDGLVPGSDRNIYTEFTNIHAMTFIGFGFFMAYLSKYAASAIGITFVVASLAVQWAILNNQFWHRVIKGGWDQPALVGIRELVSADFATCSLLIAFGAVLGRASPAQMVIVAFFEIIGFYLNENILLGALKISDIGGANTIHLFGAVFGLSLSWVLGGKTERPGPNRKSAVYSSLGLLILFIFWPSFNAALSSGPMAMRSVFNTFLSIVTATVVGFAISWELNDGLFNFEEVANAALSGGVVMGAACDLIVYPFTSMITGAVGAAVSIYSTRKIVPKLASWGIDDACCVTSLHGIPGFIGGVAAAVAAGSQRYGGESESLFQRFIDSTDDIVDIGGKQFAGVLISIGIAIVFGVVSGFVLKFADFDSIKAGHYNDTAVWVVHHGAAPASGAAHDVEATASAPAPAAAAVEETPAATAAAAEEAPAAAAAEEAAPASEENVAVEVAATN